MLTTEVLGGSNLRFLAFEIEQTDYPRARELQSLFTMRNASPIMTWKAGPRVVRFTFHVSNAPLKSL